MKTKKILLGALAITAAAIGEILFASDHIDSPTVTNQASNITDLYLFRRQDANNLVFVANTQGLMSPGTSATAKYDEISLI